MTSRWRSWPFRRCGRAASNLEHLGTCRGPCGPHGRSAGRGHRCSWVGHLAADDINDQVTAARSATRQAEVVARERTQLDEVKSTLFGTEADARDAQKRADEANTAYAMAERQASCELDGTCGTGVPGMSGAYRERRAAADAARSYRDSMQARADQLADEVANLRRSVIAMQDDVNRLADEASSGEAPVGSLTAEARGLAEVIFGSAGPVVGVVVLISATWFVVAGTMRARRPGGQLP